MGVAITIRDETPAGQELRTFTLDCLKARLSVRELIRARIYQEVREFNARQPEEFQGLVQPTETEKTLNGYRVKKGRRIDWEEQTRRAMEAFETNGFILLVGDRQAAGLDEEFDVSVDTEVGFVKLVPLLGG